MFFQNFVIFGKIFLKRTPFRLNLGQIFGSDLTKIDKQTWFIKKSGQASTYFRCSFAKITFMVLKSQVFELKTPF